MKEVLKAVLAGSLIGLICVGAMAYVTKEYYYGIVTCQMQKVDLLMKCRDFITQLQEECGK